MFECVLCIGNNSIELSLSRLRNLGQDPLVKWVDDVDVLSGGGGNPLAIQVVFVNFGESSPLRDRFLTKHL